MRFSSILAVTALTLSACSAGHDRASEQTATTTQSVTVATSAPTASPKVVAPTHAPAASTASPATAASVKTTAAASAAPTGTAIPTAAPSATPVVTVAPLPPASQVTPAPPQSAPNAPPQIVELRLDKTTVHPGETVSGIVRTSSNVASVEARIADYSIDVPKVAPGEFAMSYPVPNVPFFLRKTYQMTVIARNTAGVATTTSVPITIR